MMPGAGSLERGTAAEGRGATNRAPAAANPAVPDVPTLRSDPAAWDAFVASTPLAPYLQASPWARTKARNGWSPVRVVVPAAGGPIGAQVLVHRIGPSPWSIGYAPRGPVGGALDAEGVRAWTTAVREAARRRRLSHVVVDPEVETGGPELDWFRAAGWRPTASPQPARSRWIELTRSEDELWGDLRGKWRQYVQKARRNGVAIVEADASALGEFYAIYESTALRAGFNYRSEATYRAVYEAFAEREAARLLFARDAEGRAIATLMLVGWGRRIIEPYGGMVEEGAESRANYLLKWEAIRSSRERGFEIYDLWGLSHAGIEHFKAGFGGREVTYVGGLELEVQPLVRRAVLAAQSLRVRLARRQLSRAAAQHGAGAAGRGSGSAGMGLDEGTP